MQPLHSFFLVYGMLLIVSALLICGWFTITRGQINQLEDGTKEKVGQILKGWYFFWHREKADKKRIYYRNENLYSIYHNLKNLGEKNLTLNSGMNGPVSFDAEETFLDNVLAHQLRLGVKFEIKRAIQHHGKEQKPILVIHPYKEEEDYVFPEWLRKMTSGCITCHASLYGSICFWSFIGLSSDSFTKEWLYSWSNSPIVAIYVWLMFIISLSFVLTVFWKKSDIKWPN